MNKHELIRAFRYVWTFQRTWVLLSAAISLLMGLLPIANLRVLKALIDEVAAVIGDVQADYTATLFLLLAQFSLLLFTSFLVKGQELLDKQTQMTLDHDLQNQVLQKASSVPLAFFDLPAFQHALERVYSGHAVRFMQPMKNVLDIGRHVTTLLTFLLYLLNVHWSLVLITFLGAVPILFVLIRYGSKKYSLHFHQTPLAREGNYFKYLLIDRRAAKEVRLFQLREYLLNGWSERYRKNAEAFLQLMRREKASLVGLDGLTALFYVCAAGLMIWVARTAQITIGDFVALGQAVQGTQGAMNGIVTQLARMHETSLYLREFFKFLDTEQKEYQMERGVTPFPAPLQEGIRVENLSFRYPGSEKEVLRGVSFQIAPRERIAIVGENGSGKTTLVKCLMGLYKVSDGQISFDGVPLEELEEQDFFRNLTVIFQDFMQYDFTIRNNIAIGQLASATDQQRVELAAQQSGLDQIVHGFKEGFDTYLGRSYRDGEDLSGGQWQKVALARALFSDGQVIILDEPTAALDPLAEMEVFEEFDVLTQNKTAVFISHRMAAARMADRILVMKDGMLHEMGTHKELMLRGGEYSRMYRMQAKWYV